MSLANLLAVTQAAHNIVLLGDPQQLEQPKKGPHPEEVGLSALQHMLGSHVTIPTGRGIFLPTAHNAPPVKGLPTSCSAADTFASRAASSLNPPRQPYCSSRSSAPPDPLARLERILAQLPRAGRKFFPCSSQ